MTDIEGNFILSVPDSAVLQVSFVGYESIEVSVGGRKTLEIQLRENTVMLDNVIITALGLEKKEASLAYSIQKVKGEELTRMKEVDMITALAGKAAGVQINKNSSGIGGSAKVSLRGIRSASGDNQPLYVIDGVPMLNIGTEQAYSAIGGTANAGNRDGGDGISNLNPEDVESISILKGAPAAALYGSQAANGVILITTKKGNTAGQRNIYFSTGLTFDKAFSLPKMQNCYGVSDVVDSWGEKAYLPTSNELNDFFRTGLTSITSVSVNYGNEKIQTYFSYANTTGRGIVDKNQLTKHNINLRETAVMFNQRLKLDGNVNVMRQIVKNKPVSGGFYMNPLVGLYRFPRGEDLSYYKDNYEIYDPERKLGIQNWHTFTEDFEQNPYWIQNRIQSKETRMRSIISLSANLRINSWLTVQARGSVDYISDKMRQKFYASTAPALCGANGRYIEMDYQETLIYGDVMAMGKRKWEDFALDVAIGGSINDKNVNSTRYDSKNASLKYANVFNLANIVMNGSASIDQKIDSRRQLQSVFGTAQVGYLNVGREASIFECFTQLSSGDFSITDDKGRYYKLDASNMTFAIAENPVTNTVSKAGIYWVALDFNAMTYKMREIEKVELWNKPWFGHDVPDTAEMTYQGQGEWSISDYAWVVSHEDGRKDTRYYFICTYVDGFKERWAYYSDDCRGDQNSNPGKYPNFYNIYRFDHSKLGEWDDSWKTQNDSEGVGKKATFHIYMNNTYAADYKHTRSFK